MKHALSLASIALFLAPPASAQQTEWVNFIRQHQLASNVVWDMPVDPQGNGPSALGVQEDGALFQLWTIRKQATDVKDYLLDQKLAGAYMPQAEIEIETLDPYPHIHRTRADQPFTVKITVAGLLSGPNIPTAAKQVLAEHHLAPYPEGRTSVEVSQAIGGTPIHQGLIAQNGLTSLQYEFSNLPSGDPTQATGEEHFVVHALPDGNIPQTQLDHDFVQVWPVASGAISGVEPGDTIRFSTPSLHLQYEKLYPSSFTYLHVYKGTPSLGKQGRKVEGSKRTWDEDVPLDLVLRIDDWAEAIEEDGPHTMEIITVTPFGTERLAYLSFNVDRELTVNAQLGNLEKP